MAKSFIVWLHGLGDSGTANEPHITRYFANSDEFSTTKWAFPDAPRNRVTCNRGFVMPSWFDIYKMPVTEELGNDEKGLFEAVKNVHQMIDTEISAGTRPENIFVCGLSQGGALTLASVLLYPETLGGGAILSGWVPFKSSSVTNRITPSAKKTPILWFHGMADQTVLFSAGKAADVFLRKVGIRCKFKVYPELGHQIIDEEMEFLKSWIEEQLKRSSSSSVWERDGLVEEMYKGKSKCCHWSLFSTK